MECEWEYTSNGIAQIVNGQRIVYLRGTPEFDVASRIMVEQSTFQNNVNLWQVYANQQRRLHTEQLLLYQQQLRYQQQQQQYQQQQDQQNQMNQNWIYWQYEEPQQFEPQQSEQQQVQPKIEEDDSVQDLGGIVGGVPYMTQYGRGRKRQSDPEDAGNTGKSRRVQANQSDEARSSQMGEVEANQSDEAGPSQMDEVEVNRVDEADEPTQSVGDIPVPTIEIIKLDYISTDILSKERIDRANKHLKIYTSSEFRRRNIERMSLPIMKIQFVNVVNGDLPLFDIIGETLDTLLIAMVHKAGGDMVNTELAVGLYHPGLKENRTLWHRRKGDMVNGLILQNELARIIQSNDQVKIDDLLEFELHVFKEANLSGGCLTMNEFINGEKGYFDQDLGVRGLVRTDGKCLLKSIVMGRIHHDYHTFDGDATEKKKRQRAWKNILRSQKESMDRFIHPLEVEFGLPHNEKIHSLKDLADIAEKDPTWRYMVYIRDRISDNQYSLFKTFNEAATKTIRIGYRNQHFDMIRLDSTAIDKIYCRKCCSNHNDSHHSRVCKAVCRNCGRTGCDENDAKITCFDCKKFFKSQSCYDAHQVLVGSYKKSYCELYNRCEECDKVYTVNAKWSHNCFEKYCGKCGGMRPQQHNCCYNPPTEKEKQRRRKKDEEFRMTIYDVETIIKYLDNNVLKDMDKHEVNGVFWGSICHRCVNNDDDTCDECPPDQHISFENVQAGKTVIGQFSSEILTNAKYDKATILAHNGGRYDHHFLLAELYSKLSSNIDLTAKGRNIIGATIRGSKPSFKGTRLNTVYLRDLYNHVPMSVAAMPDAFGLDSLAKGFFPYAFNHPNNYDKVFSTLPPLEFYCLDGMSPARAEEIRKYHAENFNIGFAFNEDFHTYGKDDIRVAKAVMKSYIREAMRIFQGVNPLKVAMTTAGFVKHMLQNYHIKDGDIGYIPERGFGGVNQSEIAMKWILWKEKQDGIKLKHKLRGGEQIIAGAGVDAYNTLTKEVYQFHGCFFHGCNECFNPYEVNKLNAPATNEDLYDRTVRRTQKLRELGFTVHEIWEHTVHEELRGNAEMREFFENCRHANHLMPRTAMHGGRTQPHKLKSKAGNGKHIRYYDFCSLYPSVNVTVAYPRGQPTVHTENFPPIDGGKVPYRGLYFCDVLPPVDLKIPVLPYNHSHKLLFPLCRKCSEKSNVRGKCNHNKLSQRVLTGTFYSEELNVAIERGYKILRYHTIYSWTDWIEGGYFADFIRPILALKHQASGFPPHVKTEEEKDAYIAYLEAVDGVKLNKAEMSRNPAKRTLAKLMMNCAWGKFCENPRQSELKMFDTSDFESQRKYRHETGYRLTMLKDLPNDVTLMGRRKMESFVDTKPFANIVIGIITTAMARLRLLEALERVGAARLNYCDTDSVLFDEMDGENLMGDLIGCGLGKLEDEVPAGFEIQKFIGVAPKTYAYFMENQTGDKKHVVKAKGITVTETSKTDINLDAYEKMVDEYIQTDDVAPITTLQFNMIKEICGGVRSVESMKKMRPSMEKMHLLSDGSTRPFGYMENPIEIVNDYEFYEPTTVFATQPTLDCATQFAQRP